MMILGRRKWYVKLWYLGEGNGVWNSDTGGSAMVLIGNWNAEIGKMAWYNRREDCPLQKILIQCAIIQTIF